MCHGDPRVQVPTDEFDARGICACPVMQSIASDASCSWSHSSRGAYGDAPLGPCRSWFPDPALVIHVPVTSPRLKATCHSPQGDSAKTRDSYPCGMRSDSSHGGLCVGCEAATGPPIRGPREVY